MDIIKDKLPLVTFLALVVSTLKLSAYYWYFNVPIIFYIEVSEIILLVLNDFIFVFMALYWFFFIYILASHVKRINIYEKDYKLKGEEAKRYENKIFNLVTLIVILFLICMFFFKPYITKLLITAFLFAIIAHILFFVSYNNNLEKNIIENYKLWSFFLMLLFVVGFTTYYDVKRIEAKGGKKTVIYSQSITFNCTDTLSFLGRTRNYIFIYNRNKKSTQVLPASDVKSIIHYK